MHYNSKKKIIKKKKKSRPTDPIIFSYVTGNKHIFLFGLYSFLPNFSNIISRSWYNPTVNKISKGLFCVLPFDQTLIYV